VSETKSGHHGPDFSGRRAIVTGGAHGIGAAIADRLAGLGAAVVVLDLDPQTRHDGIVLDLADPEALVPAAADAIGRLGGVDVLVNCAGVSSVEPLRTLGLERYHRTLAVNLHAGVLLMREVSGPMSSARYGRIVNISSVHARVSEPGAMAYDVSKAGLEAATRCAALDLAPAGVLVNAVAPGFVRTRMAVADGVDELESEWFRSVYVDHARLPMGRAAAPSEIAESVAWLASESNSYVTGAVLVVDGGLTARF
jgi:3-oxoacyl-[acyl-carrier protein] reductase